MTYGNEHLRGLVNESCPTITAHGVALRNYILHTLSRRARPGPGTSVSASTLAALVAPQAGPAVSMPVLIQDVQAAFRKDMA